MFKPLVKTILLSLAIMAVIGVILLISFSLINQPYLVSMFQLQSYMQENQFGFTIFRLLLLALLYKNWASVCRWYVSFFRQGDNDTFRFLTEQKAFLFTCFLLFELLVIQDVLSLLIGVILSWV